jgi:predicted enzyme related to lactoylglutathione lyase
MHMSTSSTCLVKPAAVVYVKNLAEMSAFYAAVTGLAVTHQAADHVQLESPAFELVLVAMPAAIAEGITITCPPERRTDTPIKLVFATDSLARVRAQAAALGGELNPPEHEWAWHGQRSCDGHDPEGNVLQFRQHDA